MPTCNIRTALATASCPIFLELFGAEIDGTVSCQNSGKEQKKLGFEITDYYCIFNHLNLFIILLLHLIDSI